MSPDWIVNKEATITPKNERDNKCSQWATILGLNCNKSKEKDLKKILKLKRIDTDFPLYREDWENSEQNNTSVALNMLFELYDSKEIKLAYKWNYNKRKNQIILLMINDEANNCYYFAVKKLARITFFGMVKK